MIKQKTVTIEGDEYLLNSMPATKGLKCLKQITKVVGPAIAELDGEESFMKVIGKLLDNLDSVDVESLVKELVASAAKGNMAINFDTEFSGDYVKLFNLVKEIVEFNFGSVFTLVGITDAE